MRAAKLSLQVGNNRKDRQQKRSLPGPSNQLEGRVQSAGRAWASASKERYPQPSTKVEHVIHNMHGDFAEHNNYGNDAASVPG